MGFPQMLSSCFQVPVAGGYTPELFEAVSSFRAAQNKLGSSSAHTTTQHTSLGRLFQFEFAAAVMRIKL